MRKLLITLTILITLAYAGVVSAETDRSESLKSYCESSAVLVQKVLYEAVDDNNYLNQMIREDVGDFVPILFAQFKTEMECIMLYSVLVELVRTADAGEINRVTLNLLDQYIELLYTSGLKAKMFEGMLKDPTSWFDISTDQLVLKKVAVNLKVAHDLLVEIKKGLEELSCE